MVLGLSSPACSRKQERSPDEKNTFIISPEIGKSKSLRLSEKSLLFLVQRLVHLLVRLAVLFAWHVGE